MDFNNLKMIIGIKTTSGAMPIIVVALIYRQGLFTHLTFKHFNFPQIRSKAPYHSTFPTKFSIIFFINSVLRQLRQGCYLAAALTMSMS